MPENDAHNKGIHAFRWSGDENSHLDKPFIAQCGDISIGCYGGNSAAGAHKNEDAALAWCARNGSWRFAALFDAHATNQSAKLIIRTVEAHRNTISDAFLLPARDAFAYLCRLFLDTFSSEGLRKKCRSVQGETACLICAQKEQFVWWLSIGDCLVYLLHPELAQLGQYTLNQRHFFEWIGRVNTFDLPVPCYSSGIRELRQGKNRIVMVTDGLLECGSRPFEDPNFFYTSFQDTTPDAVRRALLRVHEERGRDSATVISWSYESPYPGMQPTG